MVIVSESTLQIEKERIDELNIKIINYPIYVNSKPFDSNYTMSIEKKEELRLLIKDKKNRVGTSGLNYNDIKKIYDEYQDEQIISIHQSFNNSKATAEVLNRITKELSDTHKIYLFDSNKISTALSVQVIEAAKAIKEGVRFEDLKILLEKNKKNTGHLGVISDLFFLRRSGRVGYAKALIGTAMKVLPLLKDDEESGSLKSLGKAKNYIQANQRFLKIIEEEMILKKSNKISILISYCGDHEKECLHFEKLIKQKDWDSSVEIHYSGPANMPHEGPDFFELGYIVL